MVGTGSVIDGLVACCCSEEGANDVSFVTRVGGVGIRGVCASFVDALTDVMTRDVTEGAEGMRISRITWWLVTRRSLKAWRGVEGLNSVEVDEEAAAEA